MNTERSQTPFCSPFSTIQQIRDLLKRQEEGSKQQEVDGAKGKYYKYKDAQFAGENLRRGVDVRSNLRVIYQWKLKAFHWLPWVREFPDNVPDELLNRALTAALKATAKDEPSIRKALETFIVIKGVRVPTASAFLTAIRPEVFTIVDRQTYKALGVEFPDRIADYLSYLRFCRHEAKRWEITLREHDRALWQYGVELASRGQQGKKRACAAS